MDTMKGQVFVESYCSSDEDQRHQSSHEQAARFDRESSPPLLLAFSITSGCGPASEEEVEDSKEPVEEWMILGREEPEEGDSNIQLNLSYWCSSEEELDSNPTVKPFKDAWPVSDKDMRGANQPVSRRYFERGWDVICSICNRTGHVAKSCFYYKKCPTCVLCGIQGHAQKDCPSRPCPSCGLPSHGPRSCEKPPVWNQLCRRCGMMGHLCDTCPDIWRQYHLTIRLEVPLQPQTIHTLKHKRHFAHCYNCSKRGHYGFECTKRRMISGTFPLLPYVCHYDTMEDILQYRTRTQKGAEELLDLGSKCPSDQQQMREPSAALGEQNPSDHGRCRTRQETWFRTGRKKTWPERRRERQHVKKLRREAQARREGGILGRSRCHSDDEGHHSDPFKSPCHSHCQDTPPPPKKQKDEAGGRKSRKSREAERWKKRGGPKRGFLYPHCDTDLGSENLFSPKQRVRHRRK